VGASTVSISWSGYVVSLLHNFGINLPAQWIASPFGVKLPDGNIVNGIANIPAVIIIFLISMLLMIGIKESARTNAVIVTIKLAVVVTFIGIGWSYINPAVALTLNRGFSGQQAVLYHLNRGHYEILHLNRGQTFCHRKEVVLSVAVVFKIVGTLAFLRSDLPWAPLLHLNRGQKFVDQFVPDLSTPVRD